MNQYISDWSGAMGDTFAPLSGGGGGGDDDGLIELLWCNGHVVMLSQAQAAPPRKPPRVPDHKALAPIPVPVQDDGAAQAWFQYPVEEEDPLERDDLFSELFGEAQAAVDGGGGGRGPPLCCEEGAATDTSSATRPRSSCTTKTEHPGPGAAAAAAAHRRGKRKQSDAMDAEDVEFESADVTCEPPAQKMTTAKRRRAAEVHNLSERRRRDRINEKMKALQELIPHCNKTDKASMLDEAIEYLKSLQLQLQMMWMGGGMAAAPPVMFPAGVHQYYMQRMVAMPPPPHVAFRRHHHPAQKTRELWEA